MKVTIIGTGYVGLTTGVVLAYLGNKVTLVDVDEVKIETLRQGKTPIHEPWLEELLALARPNLEFTCRHGEAIPGSEVIFIAVGTPPMPDGSPDLSYVRAAAQATGEYLSGEFVVVVNKSTVPIGSGNWVDALVREAFADHNGCRADDRFTVASNPEFLREGAALHDTMYADRVVIGSDSARGLSVLQELYRSILEQSFPAPPFLPRPARLTKVSLIATDLTSAELVKYAANAFLSTKISFINEIGQLAEKVGADVREVAKGMGLDARIGAGFLEAGIGWGGSCFGKDTAALVATAREYGLSMPIVQAAREVNALQRGRVVEKLLGELKILKGRTVGLLGLAFKPDTDDLRDAPALDIARKLLERGAMVKAHDPVALARVRQEHGGLRIGYCDNARDLAIDADALVLVTEWPEYRELPWQELAGSMRCPILLDGRNFLDQEQLTKAGFRYIGMGR